MIWNDMKRVEHWFCEWAGSMFGERRGEERRGEERGVVCLFECLDGRFGVVATQCDGSTLMKTVSMTDVQCEVRQHRGTPVGSAGPR